VQGEGAEGERENPRQTPTERQAPQRAQSHNPEIMT